MSGHDFDSGYCTWPRCRMFLAPGQGHQVDTRISRERYCEKHFKELMEAPDIVGGLPTTERI